MNTEAVEFKVGDRVQHRMYGNGRIVSISTGEGTPDSFEKGWPVVAFDNPNGWFGAGSPGGKSRSCQPLFLTKIEEK